jgi:hypothetical protein
VGLMTRASAGIKVLGVGASLGACAPLVVIAILLQRDVRRRTARLALLAAASLEPHVDSIRRELYNWREEVTLSEMVLEWIAGTGK